MTMAKPTKHSYQNNLGQTFQKEPFYIDVAGETDLFMIAYRTGIPFMAKGPTGCGKTRFVEHMAWRIDQELKKEGKSFPMYPVHAHEDTCADDLKGRFLLNGDWVDGAALAAVKNGGLLYLDELVEARQDTITVVHPLTDYRASLVVERLGTIVEASGKPFMVVVSYNPGYQRKTKAFKPSLRQRFIAHTFGYPPRDIEQQVIMHEAGVDERVANALIEIGQKTRNMQGQGLEEGVSTRLLIYAGRLIREGYDPLRAARAAIIEPLTDDVGQQRNISQGLADIVKTFLG